MELALKNIDWIKKAVPKTKVGHDSILAVRPFKNIWWRKRTVSAFRKIEFVSSWVQGGFLLLAAILKGRRKQDTRISNCSTYSSSDSTMRNTKLHIWSIQIFFGKFMCLWWEKYGLTNFSSSWIPHEAIWCTRLRFVSSVCDRAIPWKSFEPFWF